MDGNRWEFEEWFAREMLAAPSRSIAKERSGDGYDSGFIDHAWQAWQESRRITRLEIRAMVRELAGRLG